MAERPRRAGAPATWPIVLLGLFLTACAGGPGGGSFGSSRPIDPQTLVGLAGTEVTATLGQPEMRRVEHPAEVWQYRTDSCVLDLYLYEETGSREVVYVESRPRSGGSIDAASCVGRIAAGGSRVSG